VSRFPASLALAMVLATACRRPPPEDPAEQVYRGAVQLFAQASAASHDLTYRDPRFDAVLAELAKVPENSEFRPEADALTTRIRTAREQAAAADEESRKAIDRALAQPAFESQGRLDATQGSTVTPRVAPPRTASPAGTMPPPDPGPSQSNAARALQRSLAAGAQEPADAPAAYAPGADDSAPDETAAAPPVAPNRGSRPPPPAPPPPPPTPPGQVYGLPGPAGRAMGTRP
jgi:hypothetical protein